MHYTVDPGLYALGNPDESSPVLVTANYKMSFDALRNALPGLDAWILVLDTKGINVWCAAAKGTFGTDELVGRIQSSALTRIVNHRKIILPQLAGPGVSAHRVETLTGFKVIYGPIRADDLPGFLESGCRATPAMRIKSFSLKERAVLIPVELVQAFKPASLIILAFLLLSGFGGSAGYIANLIEQWSWAVAPILIGLLSGAILTPLLLPWIPGQAFSLKGSIIGLALAGSMILYRGWPQGWDWPRLEALSWLFIVPAISAYLAMNFTGASTYTSLSGVKKELHWAVPVEITAAGIGLFSWIWARFSS